MAENVSFGIKFKVDDKGVGQATINVKELTNVVNEVKNATSKNPFKDWLTDVMGLEALTNALSRISGAVGELTKTALLFLANAEKPYHLLWLHRMISKNRCTLVFLR